jgi:release factor glutamine methyltransferase
VTADGAGGMAAPSWAALLEAGAVRLREAGVEQPRDEALRIGAALAGLSPGALRLRATTVPEPSLGARVEEALRRRASGEPLAYVVGVAGFRHLTLRSDRRALIPRPETELLVELVLAVRREGDLADIGTGTGCLALALATEGAFARIVAVDRSADALTLARENRELVGGAAARVRLVHGDLATALRGASLDILVSNPPYLTEGEWQTLDPSVRSWEPRLALPSGDDGLAALRDLLDDGRRVLRPGGLIALELDCRRSAATAALARDFGWTDVAVHHDLFGRARFLTARKQGAAP